MLRIARVLHRRGYACRAICLPGHGAELEEMARTRRCDWKQAVARTALEMADKWRRICVVGSSLGSLLALHLAAERGSLTKAMALCSAPFFYDGWRVTRWRRMLVRVLVYSPFKKYLFIPVGWPYGVKDSSMHHQLYIHRTIPAATMAEAARLMAEVKNRLKRITTPALILHSREDEISSPRSAHFLEQQLGSHRKKKLILDDCYHLITVDRQADQVAASIADFFDEELALG